MGNEQGTEPAFVIKVEELPALNFLGPDHVRPLLAEWINRGTDQKMRRSMIDQLLRTMHQTDPSPSIVQLQRNAGLRAIFQTEAERDSFATAFSAARMQMVSAQDHLVAAMFENLQEAERVIDRLQLAGAPEHAITLLSRAGEFIANERDWRGHTKSSVAAAVAGGGLTGALFGIGVLALVPVAAPVAAISSVATLSAVFGATGGAVLRMLSDHDVDGREANYYEKQIRRGRVFVSVDTRQVPGGREAISRIFRQAIG